MSGKPKSNLQRRWPTADILRRAQFVEDAGPIRFVDTEAAARYLALEAHTLECYRSLGGGPVFHKFGKWVRYAIDDLDAWAASCKRVTTSTSTPGSRPIDQHSSKAI
jgi:hypothetical protein